MLEKSNENAADITNLHRNVKKKMFLSKREGATTKGRHHRRSLLFTSLLFYLFGKC